MFRQVAIFIDKLETIAPFFNVELLDTVAGTANNEEGYYLKTFATVHHNRNSSFKGSVTIVGDTIEDKQYTMIVFERIDETKRLFLKTIVGNDINAYVEDDGASYLESLAREHLRDMRSE